MRCCSSAEAPGGETQQPRRRLILAAVSSSSSEGVVFRCRVVESSVGGAAESQGRPGMLISRSRHMALALVGGRVRGETRTQQGKVPGGTASTAA